MATHATVWTGILSSSESSLSAGYAVLVSSTTYKVATTSNRSGGLRSDGIAITAADSTNRAFELQVAGTVATGLTGLGSGSQSWVRVTSTGSVERFTPAAGGSSDIIGLCEADGTLHLAPGFLTESMVVGATPGGSDNEVQYNNGGALGGMTGLVYVEASSKARFVNPFFVRDSDASHDYVLAVSNLAADRTVTLPLLTGNDVFVFADFAQTLTNKTLTAPVIATISNTGTLTLPTSTDTLVGRATTDTLTNKTLTSPTLGGTPVFSATDLQATGNARGKVYSNISNVQTTDGTVTSLYTWTILDEAVTLVTAEICGDKSDGSDTAAYVRRVKFKRDGGTVTAGSTEATFSDESVAGWDATIDNSTSTGRVRVTGAAATTVDWAAITTRFEVAHA